MGGFGRSTRIHSEPGCRTIRCFAAVIAAVLSGWTGLARSQEVQWQRVTDPNERAFTVEVPVGWHVEVGVVRRNGIDPRPVITMRSADRAISIFYGDHRIPVFTAPSELLASGGFQEGMLYVPAPGMRTLVAKYQTGAEFALKWGSERLGRECQDLKSAEVRALPEADRILDFGYTLRGVRLSNEAGEASFSCSLRGVPAAAYVFATTQQPAVSFMDGQNARWWLDLWTGFVAAKGRAGEATEVLTYIVNSLVLDPGWVATQGQNTMVVSRIASAANMAITQSMSDAYWYQQAMQDPDFARGSQARRGVATFYDPELGIRRDLHDRGYKWIDHAGNIISTETHEAPCSYCRELKRVSAQ
jgi:hypothetical protein